MGAIQFISSNPTTAAIRVNQARDDQQAMLENQLLTQRDQRRAAIEADQNAGIVADAMAPQPKVSPIAQVAPAQPQGDGMLAPVEPTAQTYSAEKPRPVSALATVAPDPYSRASAALQGRPGAGAMRLKLAEAQRAQGQTMQKRADAGQIEFLKATRDGDYEAAKAINDHYKLGNDGVLNSPDAWKIGRRLAQSIPSKLSPEQALAFQEAAAQEWSRVFQATGSHQEADRVAGGAGIRAAMKVPGELAHFTTNDSGQVFGITKSGQARAIDGATGRTTRFAGGGSVNDQSQIRREQWDEKKLQQHIKESADIYTTMSPEGKPVVNSEIRGAYAAMVRTFAPQEADARASAIKQKAEQLATNPETGVVDQEQFDRAYLMGMRAMSNKLRSKPAAPKPAPAQPSAIPKPAAPPLAQAAPVDRRPDGVLESYSNGTQKVRINGVDMIMQAPKQGNFSNLISQR